LYLPSLINTNKPIQEGILSLDVVIQQYDLKQVIELKEHHFLTRLLSYALILLKSKPVPTSKPILTLYNYNQLIINVILILMNNQANRTILAIR